MRFCAIAGRETKLKEGTLSITQGANERSNLSCVVMPDSDQTISLGDRIGVFLDDVEPGARRFNGSTSVLARAFTSAVVDNWTIGIWARRRADDASIGDALSVGSTTTGYGILETSTGFWNGLLGGVAQVGGSNAPVTNGVWTHLVLRRQSGLTQLFVNGLPVGSPVASSPIAPNGYMSVGAVHDGSSFRRHFDGDLAHAFLAHSALSDAEILAMASGGPGGVGRSADQFDPGGLYRYYPIRGLADPEPDSDGATTLAVTAATPISDGPMVMSANGSAVFAGEIDQAPRSGLGGQVVEDIEVRIGASDYQGLFSRRLVSGTRPSENLKTRLTWLVSTYLSTYGVTLGSDQDNGPTLEARTYDYTPMEDVFVELSTLSGRIAEIDATLTLRMLAISSRAAPFDVGDSDGNVVGDIVVEPNRVAGYANKVVIRAGDARVVEKTDSFTGDGSTDTWDLTYKVVSDRGYVTANGVFQTLGVGAQWSINSSNQLVRNGGNLPNGHVVTIVYDAQFPITVEATDSAHATNPVEVLIERADIFDKAEAQAVANAELAARLSLLTQATVRYTTHTDGLKVGMVQHVESSDRDIDDDIVITEMRITDLPDGSGLAYAVTGVTGSFIQTWRQKERARGGGSRTPGLSLLVPFSGGAAQNFEFVDVPYDSSYFTAASGTWIVPGPVTYRVAIIGKVAIVQAFLQGTTITDTGTSYVAIKLPFQTTAGGTFFYKSSLSDGIGVVNGDQIELYLPGAGWVTPEHVYVSFIVPLET